MDPLILAQVVTSGLLMGSVYALVAVGLTIIFSLMRLVNFAHGEFLMLGMFLTYWAWALFGIDPLLFLPIGAVVMFTLGALLYRYVFRRIAHAPALNQVFVTFGLIILMQNSAHLLWSPDYRRVTSALAVGGRLEIAGIWLSTAQLVAGTGAFLAFVALYWLMNKTRMGKAMRATAQDRQAAALMGIDADRMFMLAVALGAACSGIAGALLSNMIAVYPQVGYPFILISFVIVALGGFGSVPGTLIAALIVGLVEALAGFFLNPALKPLVVYAMFIVVVGFRPQGIMGKYS